MSSVDGKIGDRSQPYEQEIERGAIRNFANAIGDLAAEYHDVTAAREAGYADLVAPPTFAVTLPSHPVPGLDLAKPGIIHGEQHFELKVPIVAGDRITTVGWLTEAKTRRSAQGRMTFFTVAREGINQRGELVFRSRSVIVETVSEKREEAQNDLG